MYDYDVGTVQNLSSGPDAVPLTTDVHLCVMGTRHPPYLHLAHLICDVGLEEGEYLKKMSLCYWPVLVPGTVVIE